MTTMRLQFTLFLIVFLTAGCGKGKAGYLSRGELSAEFPTAEPVSGAYVVVPADSRVFMLQITSKQEGLSAQLAELITARDAVLKAIKPVGDMTSFQAGEPRLNEDYSSSEKREKSVANALMLRISFKVPSDPLKQVSQFVKAIEGIKNPQGARVTYSLRGTHYALSSPEDHREKLVAKAIQDLSGLRNVDTSHFKVTLSGLEKPLAVSQRSENEFLVSLQYTVNVESRSDRPDTSDTTK
jgi:hypothetical protein